MNLSKIIILFTAITLYLNTSVISKELQVTCDPYPYPEGIFIKGTNSNAIYIYTVAVRQDHRAIDAYSFPKLRASRIATEKLGKYVYNKYRYKLEFIDNKVGGIFFISECIASSDRKYYASYAWSQDSYEISKIIKTVH